MDNNQIAVIIPRYEENLSYEQQVSLQHLLYNLKDADKFYVTPKSFQCNHLEFRPKRFNDDYFSDTSSYSRLLLSTEFYNEFLEYKYILIYQLDCLVFSNQLEFFKYLEIDYIGAPWFRDENDPIKGFSRVGNGGFSLRRVSAFMNVLKSQRYIAGSLPLFADLFKPIHEYHSQSNPIIRLRNRLRVLSRVRRGVNWYLANYTLNEDRFWSDRAFFFDPDFCVAPVDVALRFAFERYPRYCFERNSHKLPFGCHAWAKWDREFWEPFLIN